MNSKKVFIAKVLLAAASLIAVTAAFFLLPTHFACRIQPAASWAFLVVLLATPLVGRLFCEALCPLGIIQSVINYIFHPRRRTRRICTRMLQSPLQRIVRWSILAIFTILLFSGFGALAWAITPYSIYAKALSLFVPGLVIFAAVLILATLGHGRFWCNWVCPAGTLFSLLSSFALLRHKVGPGCSKCRACFPKASPEKETSNGEKLTRRETLKGIAVLAAVETAEKTTDGGFAAVSLPGSPSRDAAALPPGALPRSDFNLKCVACGLCVKACRGDCLSLSVNLRTFGQPQLDFRHGFCLPGCKGACASVCPTGAITLNEKTAKADIQVGRAIYRRDLCIRTIHKVKCTACSRKCPAKAIKIVDGFPLVDETICVGCGACEHVCPSRPEPAIYVEGFADRQRVIQHKRA